MLLVSNSDILIIFSERDRNETSDKSETDRVFCC